MNLHVRHNGNHISPDWDFVGQPVTNDDAAYSRRCQQLRENVQALAVDDTTGPILAEIVAELTDTLGWRSPDNQIKAFRRLAIALDRAIDARVEREMRVEREP